MLLAVCVRNSIREQKLLSWLVCFGSKFTGIDWFMYGKSSNSLLYAMSEAINSLRKRNSVRDPLLSTLGHNCARRYAKSKCEKENWDNFFVKCAPKNETTAFLFIEQKSHQPHSSCIASKCNVLHQKPKHSSNARFEQRVSMLKSVGFKKEIPRKMFHCNEKNWKYQSSLPLKRLRGHDKRYQLIKSR